MDARHTFVAKVAVMASRRPSGRGRSRTPWVVHDVEVAIPPRNILATTIGPGPATRPYLRDGERFLAAVEGPGPDELIDPDRLRELLAETDGTSWPNNPFPWRRPPDGRRVEERPAGDPNLGPLDDDGSARAAATARDVAANLAFVRGVLHRTVAKPVLALTFDMAGEGRWANLRCVVLPADEVPPHAMEFPPGGHAEVIDTLDAVPGMDGNLKRLCIDDLPGYPKGAADPEVPWTVPEIHVPDELRSWGSETFREALAKVERAAASRSHSSLQDAILGLDAILADEPPPPSLYGAFGELSCRYMLFEARMRAAGNLGRLEAPWAPAPVSDPSNEVEDEGERWGVPPEEGAPQVPAAPPPLRAIAAPIPPDGGATIEGEAPAPAGDDAKASAAGAGAEDMQANEEPTMPDEKTVGGGDALAEGEPQRRPDLQERVAGQILVRLTECGEARAEGDDMRTFLSFYQALSLLRLQSELMSNTMTELAPAAKAWGVNMTGLIRSPEDGAAEG